MSVILRDVPGGYDWGWYSREDPRMHLQTVDREHRNSYKVWLEHAGRRVFEPIGKIPAKVLKLLEKTVQEKRPYVEGWWVDFMIERNWLEHQVAGPKVVLTAYPRLPTRFVRTLDLSHDFRPDLVAQLRPEDIVISQEMAAVEVWPQRPEESRHHFRLSTILWHD